MISSKKGYRREYFARKELIADGWDVVFKSVRYRYGTIDYAKLFDICCYKGQERKFISCKHFGNSNYYLPHQEDIKKFKDKYGKEGESYELWEWKDSRWEGRGINKKWRKAEWIKIIL